MTFQISVFNRTVSKVDAFIENEAKGTNVVGTHSIEAPLPLSHHRNDPSIERPPCATVTVPIG